MVGVPKSVEFGDAALNPWLLRANDERTGLTPVVSAGRCPTSSGYVLNHMEIEMNQARNTYTLCAWLAVLSGEAEPDVAAAQLFITLVELQTQLVTSLT